MTITTVRNGRLVRIARVLSLGKRVASLALTPISCAK
jgi:hypothetical protein